MVIVGNSMILRKFKLINEFRQDLGRSLTSEENLGDATHPNYKTVLKFKDPFVKKYNDMYGNYAFKHGDIGKLKIYCDENVKNNLLSFYTEDNRVYDIDYDGTEFRGFLNRSLNDIDNKEREAREIEVQQKNTKNEVIKTKHMSQEELIEYLLNKRNSENG